MSPSGHKRNTASCRVTRKNTLCQLLDIKVYVYRFSFTFFFLMEWWSRKNKWRRITPFYEKLVIRLFSGESRWVGGVWPLSLYLTKCWQNNDHMRRPEVLILYPLLAVRPDVSQQVSTQQCQVWTSQGRFCPEVGQTGNKCDFFKSEFSTFWLGVI